MAHVPKLVASDIGGTLIPGINPMPGFTAQVLNGLAASHIPVALITGYNYTTTLEFARDLDQRILLMPQNGTLCIKEKKLVWEYHIPQPEACQLYDYLDKRNLPIVVYKGKNENFRNVYVSKKELPSLDYGFEWLFRLDDFRNISGISTLLPDDLAREVRGNIQRIVGDKFKVIYTLSDSGSWLEVCHADVRKDLALKRLCHELSIPLADTLYFGDNFNDLEALRIVGHPVLVENAAPELKKEFGPASIIASVHKQGVAHYLNDLYHLNLD